MLNKITYSLPSLGFKANTEALEKSFDFVCIFDSNSNFNKNEFVFTDQLIAIGAVHQLSVTNSNSLEQLETFINQHKGNWMFGYLSYDIKNEIEHLTSLNDDGLSFPPLQFFVPKMVIQINSEINLIYNDEYISADEAEAIFKIATDTDETKKAERPSVNFEILPKITKDKYLSAVTQLQQHIQHGDIYEINFCQEFYATKVNIKPANVFTQLNTISSAPFAAYAKFKNHYILCSSPERYIAKRGGKIISQPIKGTIKRSAIEAEDNQLKQQLRNSKKEQNENVMIVDLVRNDLSRIAVRGSVNVDELFGVYSFKQVHQLISTVSCELKENLSFTDIIKGTFPMGSMTGAPKISAMKLIEQYESTKRGVYSGCIGYISPEGDFDFNVIIRSILYNTENKYLSFMVGSAITHKANAEAEYEECLLKAKALFEALLKQQ